MKLEYRRMAIVVMPCKVVLMRSVVTTIASSITHMRIKVQFSNSSNLLYWFCWCISSIRHSSDGTGVETRVDRNAAHQLIHNAISLWPNTMKAGSLCRRAWTMGVVSRKKIELIPNDGGKIVASFHSFPPENYSNYIRTSWTSPEYPRIGPPPGHRLHIASVII